MPIGDIPNVITETELKKRYDDLIKEALFKAAPSLDVTRADEVSAPGTINNEIVTRLMHSDLVLADITFPNPNVFYELGLRHAARAGTLLIKERDGKYAPFDVHPLRHIPYDNTPSGMKNLAEELRKNIEWLIKNPAKPDNTFLELAHFTKYPYPKTQPVNQEAANKQASLMMKIIGNPAFSDLLQKSQVTGGQLTFEQLREMMAADPAAMQELVTFMAEQGSINFGPKA